MEIEEQSMISGSSENLMDLETDEVQIEKIEGLL